MKPMARENPSWGEERIANELFLKLGLRVSPRTIRKFVVMEHASICRSCRPHRLGNLAAISVGQPFLRITPSRYRL